MIFVQHLADAKRELEEDAIHLILIGARFDESRMFDLLGYVRADAEHKKIPVVAAIIAPTRMAEETVTGLAHTTKLFGASIFINLNDFADEEGENTRLRIIVDALLLPSDLVPVAASRLTAPPP